VSCPKCKKSLTRPMGFVSGTPEAPLARMTSEKFDLGRNFCNKLWNACRFALANLESVNEAPSQGASAQTLADRWIVARFSRTVAECDEALKSYRFDVYAK